MVNKFEKIYKDLQGQIQVVLFATSTGLILAHKKEDHIDERVVGAMVSLLIDLSYGLASELHLSDVQSLKLKFQEDYILMRNIILRDNRSQCIFAILTRLPENEDMERNIDELFDLIIERYNNDDD